ncbi:MAG: HD domain-containing protein [Clostridiales bacterium]|nr:HD domain-containing protein [Clostridiales bacterium]
MKKTANNIKSLYIMAEEKANAFNLKCLAVLCTLTVFTEILNELKVFRVPPYIMRPTALFSFVIFSIPVIVYLIRDRVMKKGPSVLQNPSFKFVIICISFLGIAMLSISLSFHAVILLAIPPLIAAQYRENKCIHIITVIATIILAPVSVYGSFFLGAVDKNLLKGLTDDAAENFATRLALATPKRMVDLFTHYTVPRILSVVAVTVLTTGITKRNRQMLEEQGRLSEKVQEDIERINKMQSHVIDALANLIETRDVGTGEHVARTKEYVKTIAYEMQKEEKYKSILTDEYIGNIYGAAPLHDIGKIAISDTILLKPGPLIEEEFNKMKTHTVKGGDMISKTFAAMNDVEFLKIAEEIAVSHHEKWDGTGYPYRLKGEKIPLSARIMAVADVFDALTSVRVYKDMVSPEKAIDIMLAESGTHFDPSIMSIVERLRDKLINMAISPVNNSLPGSDYYE